MRKTTSSESTTTSTTSKNLLKNPEIRNRIRRIKGELRVGWWVDSTYINNT